MLARIDLAAVHCIARSFPHEGWKSIEAKQVIADRRGQIHSDWSAFSEVEGVGGVYAMLLPSAWFAPSRTIHLHASHSFQGEQISFEFTVPMLTQDQYGVVYVGRTANLAERWRGHLRNGERKDGGQVKFGLVDCKRFATCEEALKALRAHGRLVYTALPGPENCANRDVLEMALCARFAPAFNIKSER